MHSFASALRPSLGGVCLPVNVFVQNSSYVTKQIQDLSCKLENCSSAKKPLIPIQDDKLDKVEKDSRSITCECIHGLMAQMLKANLFSRQLALNPPTDPSTAAELDKSAPETAHVPAAQEDSVVAECSTAADSLLSPADEPMKELGDADGDAQPADCEPIQVEPSL